MNLPNKITLLRVLITPLAISSLYINFPYHITISLLLFILAMATDPIDGFIARKYNMVTSLGALLDPLIDKFIIGGLFICLVDLDVFPIWIILIILGRETLVTTFRNIGKENNVTIKALPSGKIKTLFQTLAVSLGLLLLAVQSSEISSLISYTKIIEKSALILLIISLIISIYSMLQLFIKHRNSVIKNLNSND